MVILSGSKSTDPTGFPHDTPVINSSVASGIIARLGPIMLNSLYAATPANEPAAITGSSADLLRSASANEPYCPVDEG